MTEAELSMEVSTLARELGILRYHVPNSTRAEPGFPDWVLVGNRVLFRELKSGGGRLTAEQTEWRYRLLAAGADWGLWRPRDWDSGRIEHELRRLTSRTE